MLSTVVPLDIATVPSGDSLQEGFPRSVLIRTPPGILLGTVEHPWHTVSKRESLCEVTNHTRNRQEGNIYDPGYGPVAAHHAYVACYC